MTNLLSSTSFCIRPPVRLYSKLVAKSARYIEQRFKPNIPYMSTKFITSAKKKANGFLETLATRSIQASAKPRSPV